MTTQDQVLAQCPSARGITALCSRRLAHCASCACRISRGLALPTSSPLFILGVRFTCIHQRPFRDSTVVVSSCCPKASTSKCLLSVLLATRAGPAVHRCSQHVPSRASRNRRISSFDQLAVLLQFGPCSRCPVSVQCPPVNSALRARQKMQHESSFSSAVRKCGLVVCCLVVMRSVAQPGSCPHGRDGRALSACQRVRS